MARRPAQRRSQGHPLATLCLAVLIVATVWFASLYVRIARYARVDHAAPADAIAVFGAAQYLGHPSPVYHARLDHAVSLYNKGLARTIVTLGGASDARTGQSEGSVGRDYLLAQGVPNDHIIAETESVDTEEQVDALAALSAEDHFGSIIAVSDGTHLFRIHALCLHRGLTVLTSPRAPFGTLSAWGQTTRIVHEMLSYTFLKLHLQADWAKQWIDRREDG